MASNLIASRRYFAKEGKTHVGHMHDVQDELDVHLCSLNMQICKYASKLAMTSFVNWGPFLEAPGNYRAR